MRRILALLAFIALSSPAWADWTGKDASGATITFKNTNTCSSAVCIPIAQPVDNTGAPFGVTGNPFFVSPASGATFPVSGTFWPYTIGQQLAAASVPVILPAATITTLTPPSNTGYSTAANQSTEITSLGTIATNSGTQATAANQATIITDLGTLHSDNTATLAAINSPIAAGTDTIGTTGSLPYPVGAVPLTASATGTTAATTATLAGTTGKTTYICGYSIRANATANTNVTDTLTGVISGTMSSALWVPANTAGLGVDEQIFSPCIPASATNTAINAVSGAPGTGGVVTVKAWGFQL